MKKAYIIPHHNLVEGNNKQTIKKAIELLSNQYLIDFEFFEDRKKIEVLETIANLTHIYLNMSLEEW